MLDCLHLEFDVRARVFRLTAVEGGPATGFTVELQVRCKACTIPFRFIGLPNGSLPDRPTISAWGDELRAPLIPAPDVPTWDESEPGHG